MVTTSQKSGIFSGTVPLVMSWRGPPSKPDIFSRSWSAPMLMYTGRPDPLQLCPGHHHALHGPHHPVGGPAGSGAGPACRHCLRVCGPVCRDAAPRPASEPRTRVAPATSSWPGPAIMLSWGDRFERGESSGSSAARSMLVNEGDSPLMVMLIACGGAI